MRTLTVIKKSRGEIAGEFNAVFNELKPDETVTQEQRLAQYREQVLKQRKRGFSWKLIATGMRDPRIGEKASAKVLKELFGGTKTAPTTTHKRTPKAAT
jgi:hypothetical protein